jgi:hypothetical protein
VIGAQRVLVMVFAVRAMLHDTSVGTWKKNTVTSG